MRTAVLLVRKHESDAFEMLCGPEVPLADQHAQMREFIVAAASKRHEDYAEVQLWTSDGGLQRAVKMMSPEQHTEFSAKQAADAKAHQEYLDSLTEAAETEAETAKAEDAKKKVRAKAKKQE